MRVMSLALFLALLAAIGMAGPPAALAGCADSHGVAIATSIGGTDWAIAVDSPIHLSMQSGDPPSPMTAAINMYMWPTGGGERDIGSSDVAVTVDRFNMVSVAPNYPGLIAGADAYSIYDQWRIHAGADAGGI